MQTTIIKPTYVTQPSIAPLEEYQEILQSAWETGILTHNGPLVQRLEKDLQAYLNVQSMVAVTNGTVALQMAIRALKLKGEIITTPFSWIATVSSIKWEGCTPVFVDIDQNTLNIDPKKIEAAITDNTCAIMPVHVFSNPCDVEAIEAIAKKYQLKVIYDAAHALCVDYKGKSLLEYGDITATSFHATKLFNTGEGGGCTATNPDLHEKLKRIRFFGHNDKKDIVEDGFNGKMTEVHAALGLANLKYLDKVRARRKQIFEQYYEQLSSLEAIRFQQFDSASYNYSYLPVIFDSEAQLTKIAEKLTEEQVFGRRYFYPSLNTVKIAGQYTPMPRSEDISSRIFCLPSFHKLSTDKIDEICTIIRKNL